jgi:hypothetical protein
MKLRTFAWTPDNPDAVEHAVLTVADAEVPAYITRLDTEAREQGFSYASYSTAILPWAVLRFYDAVTGETGTRCEHTAAGAR